jgi:hypothetical protein
VVHAGKKWKFCGFFYDGKAAPWFDFRQKRLIFEKNGRNDA